MSGEEVEICGGKIAATTTGQLISEADRGISCGRDRGRDVLEEVAKGALTSAIVLGLAWQKGWEERIVAFELGEGGGTGFAWCGVA